MKTQDVLINCGFCGRKLKPFERDHGNKTNDLLCLFCWSWFKEEMVKAKFEVDLEEEYL